MAKNLIFEAQWPASQESYGHKFSTGGKVLPRSDGMSFSKIVRAVFEKNAKTEKCKKGPPRDTSVMNLVSPNAQLSLEGTCKVWFKSYGQFWRNQQKGCFCGKTRGQVEQVKKPAKPGDSRSKPWLLLNSFDILQQDAFFAIERLAGETSSEGDRKKTEKSPFWIFFRQNSLKVTCLTNL